MHHHDSVTFLMSNIHVLPRVTRNTEFSQCSFADSVLLQISCRTSTPKVFHRLLRSTSLYSSQRSTNTVNVLGSLRYARAASFAVMSPICPFLEFLIAALRRVTEKVSQSLYFLNHFTASRPRHLGLATCSSQSTSPWSASSRSRGCKSGLAPSCKFASSDSAPHLLVVPLEPVLGLVSVVHVVP